MEGNEDPRLPLLRKSLSPPWFNHQYVTSITKNKPLAMTP